MGDKARVEEILGRWEEKEGEGATGAGGEDRPMGRDPALPVRGRVVEKVTCPSWHNTQVTPKPHPGTIFHGGEQLTFQC